MTIKSLGEKLSAAVRSRGHRLLSGPWAALTADERTNFESVALTFYASLSHDEATTATIETLAARVATLEAAVRWALGEGDSDFHPRGENDPPYWWRRELRRRALLSPTQTKD